MMINQAEAKRLRRRVRELEDLEAQREHAWATDYPGGTHIGSADFTALPKEISAITTARKLKHAVVIVPDGNTVRFYALRLAREVRS